MYKIIIVVLAAIILLGGWYVFITRGPAEPPASATLVSTSFSCADGTNFVAEFTKSNTLRILVAGDIARTLPRAEGAGQRYEDAEYRYVFAGEEVEVTAKSTSQTTTCTQPFDPNNAPMNLGDRAEGAGEAQDASAAVSLNIIGSWKSNDDARFVRVFRADGTTEDRYDGEVVATGAWTAALGANIQAEGLTFETDAVYVRITEGNTLLNFKVVALTPEHLELIYMDRGGMLSFTRSN